LDYILSNTAFKETTSLVNESTVSDHRPVLTTLLLEERSSGRRTFEKIRISRLKPLTIENYREIINSGHWPRRPFHVLAEAMGHTVITFKPWNRTYDVRKLLVETRNDKENKVRLNDLGIYNDEDKLRIYSAKDTKEAAEDLYNSWGKQRKFRLLVATTYLPVPVISRILDRFRCSDPKEFFQYFRQLSRVKKKQSSAKGFAPEIVDGKVVEIMNMTEYIVDLFKNPNPLDKL
jgi:hypothetical protein